MDARRIRSYPSLMSAWILRRRTVTLKHLQNFAGRWLRKLQCKREASCVFYAFWKWFTRCDQKFPPNERRGRVTHAFDASDACRLQLQVSHLAVCTDASELGDGLCYSTGLTKCGGVQACALACGHECAMTVNHGETVSAWTWACPLCDLHSSLLLLTTGGLYNCAERRVNMRQRSFLFVKGACERQRCQPG